MLGLNFVEKSRLKHCEAFNVFVTSAAEPLCNGLHLVIISPQTEGSLSRPLFSLWGRGSLFTRSQKPGRRLWLRRLPLNPPTRPLVRHGRSW